MVDEPAPRADVPPSEEAELAEELEPELEPDETRDFEPADEVTELRERVTELEERLLRTLADLDNVRKRAARQALAAREEERAAVAAEWLPVIDHLDLALAHAAADPATIVDGVRAVREQALAVMNRLGFPRRDDVGIRFDPAHHEAVGVVSAGETPPGTVIDVVRPGYGTLRPASVVVSKERDGDQES